MRLLCIASLASAALAISAAAQPSINANGIVNVASYAIPGLPNSSIAQGSIFVIFGKNIGPATLAQASSFPIPTVLGGTSVKITAGSQNFDAPMIYTTASQVAAIMPSTTPVGTVSATVTFNGATSAPQTFQVVPSSFGTFSINQQGNGGGVFTNANYQIYLANSAARPGDAVIIWGTGLGPVSFPDSGAPQAINMTNIPVQVYVGGKVANVSYQGRSGCCSGLDQIVFTVPAGIEGCSVPVVVKINNVVSNTTTMPITSSSTRVCSDVGGITSTDLLTLLGKSNFNFGVITLSRSTTTSPLPAQFGGGTTTSDGGSATFINFTPVTFAGASTSLQQAALGSCIVSTFSSSSTGTVQIPTFTGLDAGPAINISNTAKGQKQLLPAAQQKGFYSATLSSGTPPAPTVTYLDGGNYAIDNGAGGTDVKNFSLILNVGQQPLTWTNMAAVSANPIDRGTGVTVNWTGGIPGTEAIISGGSVVTGPPVLVASFTCRAPVEAGTFTVGPDVLLQLPPSTVISAGGFTISTSSLSVGNTSNPVKFTATGLDYGYAATTVSNSASVTYK